MAMKEFCVALFCSMRFCNRASAHCDPLVDWELFVTRTATRHFRNQRCCCYGVDCVSIFLRYCRCYLVVVNPNLFLLAAPQWTFNSWMMLEHMGLYASSVHHSYLASFLLMCVQ